MELRLENVRKTYGTVQALDGISYSFGTGVYGLLGANGAGKSTMINLITDNIKRDRNGGRILFGEGSCDGDMEDILKLGKRFREKVGYMPQQQGFYEDFTPEAFLRYMAEVKGIKSVQKVDESGRKKVRKVKEQIDELLNVVNLSDVAHQKIGGFSGGMRQRVMLAQALLGNPKVLILDEPTAGLDPKERISLRNYIAQLGRDRIVILATHVVSDIECIADRVLILRKGRLVVEGTPLELMQSVSGKVGELKCVQEELEQLQKRYKSGNVRQRKDGLVLRVVGDELPKEAVVTDGGMDLEDVFLYYSNFYETLW